MAQYLRSNYGFIQTTMHRALSPPISLSQLDLSLVVPITNSLTTVITALAGRIIGEEESSHNIWSYCGMALVCLGSSLCIYGKV